jgi:uncharacterized protein (DUF1697 family)
VKYVAFLRGINVGGKNILPMKDLAAMFETAGCSGVRTYIQSGNVVFTASDATMRGVSAAISERIAKRFGYKVPVVIRDAKQMAKVARNNPHLKKGADEKTVHVAFLLAAPDKKAVAALDPARSPGDTYEVRGAEIYMHLPNGAGNTKLTNAYFDSKLSTVSTGRNWATVCKILAMLEEEI